MKRVSYPYTVWEDWRSGMYQPSADLEAETVGAMDLLGNPDGLGEAMRDVCVAWPTATEHNLSNEEQNRRAWLGQAACRYTVGSARFATCSAWGRLTQDQRDEANAVADTVIAAWEAERSGVDALFGLDLLNPTTAIPLQRIPADA